MIIELGAGASTNTIGLYKFGDSANRVTVFEGAADKADTATLFFNADGSVQVALFARDNTTGALQGIKVFNAANFGSEFGFFLTTGSGITFFTEDSLNPGQAAQALTYHGDGSKALNLPGNSSARNFNSLEWIIAFDDASTADANKNFTDAVFLVESIEPVPEPASLLVWSGIGAVGAGAVAAARRRRGRWSEENRQAIYGVISRG